MQEPLDLLADQERIELHDTFSQGFVKPTG
jgi:hypothetical protein